MPSIINELLVTEVQTMVEAGNALLFVDAAGLKAEETVKLRRDLNGVGAKMKVAKASLVRHIVPEELRGHLDAKGSIGMVSGEDIGAAAKIIRDLVKDEKVSVRAGFIEGRALDEASAQKLADLPSREQLNGMLVNVLAAPMVGLMRVINEVPTSFVRVLAAIKEKQS